MHLLVISLLTILAGTLLLAKFRKEVAGKFFAFISWFFIVVGFILFIGFIGGGICRIANDECPWQSGCQHEMMIKKCDPEMHGGFCCPKGTYRGICGKKPVCMQKDSMMKVCPKHMESDSVKEQLQK